jgi:hypothetical protein
MKLDDISNLISSKLAKLKLTNREQKLPVYYAKNPTSINSVWSGTSVVLGYATQLHCFSFLSVTSAIIASTVPSDINFFTLVRILFIRRSALLAFSQKLLKLMLHIFR